MKVYSHWNPTYLHVKALADLLKEGDEVSPRGMKVKEIRPAVFEYLNPRNQVTFVKGRKINPFFQRAECLWILAGASDVAWLTAYNKNMSQFSDDGVHFNAPYGERLRFWGKNDYRSYIYNPIDQLKSVYDTLKADPDSRQAVAAIWNPMFDGFHYKGKDRPCNMILTFKIRKGKLDLTVFNRSNDLIYGTFGANLAQFSTILLVMASWLGVEPGTYYQITDSLHIYLEHFGYKEIDKILNAYGGLDKLEETEAVHFSFENEPVPKMSFEEFEGFLHSYLNGIHDILHDDEFFKTEHENLAEVLNTLKDDYFRDTMFAMFTYRGHRLGITDAVLNGLSKMNDSQWKISCLYFMYNKYGHIEEFRKLYEKYPEEVKAYIEGKGDKADAPIA